MKNAKRDRLARRAYHCDMFKDSRHKIDEWWTFFNKPFVLCGVELQTNSICIRKKYPDFDYLVNDLYSDERIQDITDRRYFREQELMRRTVGLLE